MTSRVHESDLSAAVERALRRGERSEPRVQLHPKQPALIACITISREAGARGTTIARHVAKRTGWTVYHQELLEYIAHEAHQRAGVLETLEHPANAWTNEWLATLLGKQWEYQESYIVCLARVVLAVALRGDSILVGRGAPFIVPRDRSLHVRIIAAEPARVAYLSHIKRMTPHEAARLAAETDAQRVQFVHEYFRRDSRDPHGYDLVLDSSQLGEDRCAELVVSALQGREALLRQRQDTPTRASHVPVE